MDAIPASDLAGVRDDHRIAGLDEALRLNYVFFEDLGKDILVEAQDLGPPPVDARVRRTGRRPIQLHIRMVQRLQGLEVAPVKRASPFRTTSTFSSHCRVSLQVAYSRSPAASRASGVP